MSYSNRFSNAITIAPPLNIHEIRQATARYDWSESFDAHLRINRDETTAVDGESVLIYITETADAILGPAEACNGYDVAEQIQTIVDLFTAGHSFGGFIELDPDPGFGDSTPSRFVVRGGRVVEVKPMLVWPEDGAA